MTEENTTEDTQAEDTNIAIREAFDNAVDAEKNDDSIKMDMIGAGATFKNVTRLYNEFMVDAGLEISKDEKSEIITEIMEDEDTDVSTEDGFEAAVKAVCEKNDKITDKSSAALIRAWAKKNEVEVYKKPKGTGVARNPFVQNFHAALIENPEMDEAGLKAIIADLTEDQQRNPNRWFSQHNAIRKMVNKIAENLS